MIICPTFHSHQPGRYKYAPARKVSVMIVKKKWLSLARHLASKLCRLTRTKFLDVLFNHFSHPRCSDTQMALLSFAGVQLRLDRLKNKCASLYVSLSSGRTTQTYITLMLSIPLDLHVGYHSSRTSSPSLNSSSSISSFSTSSSSSVLTVLVLRVLHDNIVTVAYHTVSLPRGKEQIPLHIETWSYMDAPSLPGASLSPNSMSAQFPKNLDRWNHFARSATVAGRGLVTLLLHVLLRCFRNASPGRLGCWGMYRRKEESPIGANKESKSLPCPCEYIFSI